MDKHWARVATTAGSIWLVLSCLSPRHADGSPARTKTFQEVPIGLGEDYPATTRSFEQARRDLEVLRTNDLHLLRISFSWAEVEAQPGRYDWTFWDQFVALATDKYQIRLIPYVCYTPRWAASATNQFWSQPPANMAKFTGFIRELVKRYHTRIHSWEIWNEPDNADYWCGSVEQFEELLQAGSTAVRETDPEAKVVMGGLAWNLGFLEAMSTNAVVLRNVDVVNLHDYRETWSSEAAEQLPDYVARAHDILVSSGRVIPIWLAEIGYSNFRPSTNISATSGSYHGFFEYEHTAAYQAASVFRMLTLALASGDVSLVTWYRLNDLPSAQEVIGDANNRYLGVMNEHGQAKPDLAALFHFHRLFAQGFRSLDADVRVNRTISSETEVHAFELWNGRIILIAWLRAVVPGKRGFSDNHLARDQRREELQITLPFITGKSILIGDEIGQSHGFLAGQVRAGQTHIAGVNIADGHVTVLSLQRVDAKGGGS